MIMPASLFLLPCRRYSVAARREVVRGGLVVIEVVGGEADARVLREVFQDRLIDGGGPVVDVDDLVRRRGRAERQDESDRTCRNGEFIHDHACFPVPASL